MPPAVFIPTASTRPAAPAGARSSGANHHGSRGGHHPGGSRSGSSGTSAGLGGAPRHDHPAAAHLHVSHASHRISRRSARIAHQHAAAAARASSVVARYAADATAAAPVSGERVLVHYYRRDGEAPSFGLHVWEDVANETDWHAPLPSAVTPGKGGDWATYEVILAPDARKLSFIVHRGDESDSRVESLDVDSLGPGRAVYVVSGNARVFTTEPEISSLPTGDVNLAKARAHWIASDLVAVPFAVTSDDGVRVELVASADAGLHVGDNGVWSVHEHSETRYVTLERVAAGWSYSPSTQRAGDKYPHVRDAGYAVMRIPDDVPDDARAWMLKCQLAVTAHDADGRLRDATSVQSHGALDDVFGGYEGELGCVVDGGGAGARMSLWAPNARRVTLLLHRGPRGGDDIRVEMREGERDGVWRASVGAEWAGGDSYYRYEIETYHPWGEGAPDGGLGSIVTSVVTDPYSRSLGADGERTHVCDVNAPELKPPGWDGLRKPKPPGGGDAFEPTDMAIYELHVRDFSTLDESTPAHLRGKYAAFTCEGTAPVRHLENLAKAGLTHVHLLPSYDFGSVPERVENQANVDHGWLASLPSNSDEQQAAIGSIANDDAFNWGYDPVHYGVPEGSYATDPDGGARIVEYRVMVAGLAKMGLRTVCDVVYNHTLSAGPHDRRSVLDKCVPGYYHRRNLDGFYENSTCCNNTASENSMMERLIVDDLVHWAVDYKIDGFRFDLMGHIMLRTILRARDALAALTVERDGVDGRSIYLYGEGWDYAEVERNRVGKNASQLNLAGTGVGSFNDRLREGIMGGSPFGDPRVQGVLTGLYFAPNGFIDQGTADNQRNRVMEDCEKVIAAMAGNLKEYRFVNRKGFSTPGKDAAWVGSNVGYAAEPRETVNYVSAHDNETLFDGIMLRSAPDVPLAVRCRLNRIAVAVVAFSQGVPFFHAGDEILRSKSLDRDSYNSGDWFNRLDYTGETHNFGIGLPGRDKNGDRYGYIGHLLGDLSLRPGRDEIARSDAHMRECLAIRRSSPLFRLRTAADMDRRVTFYNVGPEQEPGVIAMMVRDAPKGHPEQLCDRFQKVLVCVNVTGHAVTVKDEQLGLDIYGCSLETHPLQGMVCPDEYLASATCVGGAPTVPPHSVVVFVERR